MNNMSERDFDEIWKNVEMRLENMTIQERIIKSIILHPFTRIRQLTIVLWLSIIIFVYAFNLRQEFISVFKSILF